jgi:Protein of unknown function (DUF3892)
MSLLEVQHINKSTRQGAHERILNIGGCSGALDWKHAEAKAIAWIEDGTFAYFVILGGHAVGIMIATSADGRKYLKTKADVEHPNSLLTLPECPQLSTQEKPVDWIHRGKNGGLIV